MKGMEFLEKLSETDCANIANAMASHGLSDFAQAVKMIFSENHSGANWMLAES